MACTAYNVRIQVEDPRPLDGVTPLSPGSLDLSSGQNTINAVIPVGSRFGLFDPGELVTSGQARFYVVTSLSVVADGVATWSNGAKVGIQGPDRELSATPPPQQTVVDLAVLADGTGVIPLTNEAYPNDHRISFDTLVDGNAGPYLVQMTLLCMDGEGLNAMLFGGTAPGGLSGVIVRDDGAVVQPASTDLNFTGTGVSVIPGPGNQAVVDIPSTGAPLTVVNFLDDAVEDLVVGAFASDVFVDVALNLWQMGLSMSYLVRLTSSDTDTLGDVTCLLSDKPLNTVDVSGIRDGADLKVRLSGTGTGISTRGAYRIVNTIPKP